MPENKKDILSKKQYKNIMEIAPIATVDVLFFNKDKTKIILFKRNNNPLKGVYFSTGGRLIKGEKIIDCAKRQAFREAGLRINKKNLTFAGVHEGVYKNSIFNNVSYHAVGFFYAYIFNNDDTINLDSQHSSYKWFSVNDKKIHPLIKKHIVEFLKNSK